ncbi:MAG: AAA family ATPase [Pseudomonadota bacterium]
MILEGNERGHGAELARHLMNPRDNDHVTVHAVDGFIAEDLHGAFAEAEAISHGTKCKKYLFSLSLNPPPSANVSVEVFEDTIARVEQKLGLTGQPRAVAFHEKDGRLHAHAVWSRIDATQMKAINLSHYKSKLVDLSRDLYHEHGWDMPEGFRKREDRDPQNTTRQESQQAKRLKRDRAATKAMFRACWEGSDSRAAFEAALNGNGFLLARGDRRGFVAVDADGKVWSLSRWCEAKPKELRARLGPEEHLPSIAHVLGKTADLRRPETQIPDPRHALRRAELVARQRQARKDLLEAQERRRQVELKTRLPKGIRATFLKVTGRWQKIVAEAEAAARAAQQRVRQEQQALIDRHLAERRRLDQQFQTKAPQEDPRQKLVVAKDDASFTAQELERAPSLALAHLSRTKASFTRTDVLKTIATRIDDPQTLKGIADAALQSKDAVRLSSDGAPRYTTQDYQAAERRLGSAASYMAARKGFGVRSAHISDALKLKNAELRRTFGGKLSDEQQSAIRHVLGDRQLASVVGLAGAGKSTMLSAAADAWRRQGVTVHGAALAGKAADGLESASGIKSRTLASLEMSWENGNEPIARGDVLVVDEAGMIGMRQMARVTTKLQEIGAKLVLVGDPEQLQPIEAGTPFRDLVAKHGAAELKDIYRQREDWQRAASRALAEGHIPEALSRYAKTGAVSRQQDRDAAIEALVESYAMDSDATPNKTRLAFAHRRKDVHALNVAIREALRSGEDDAQPETLLQTSTGPRAFAAGDRFVFGQNDKELGVMNGMLGTVSKVSERSVTVEMDGDRKQRVTFDPRHYTKFDHGYAVTIHKSQGATVDQAYVLGSRSMDRHLAYVAMTRHRDDLRVFLSQDDLPTWARHRPSPHHDRDGPQRTQNRGPSLG